MEVSGFRSFLIESAIRQLIIFLRIQYSDILSWITLLSEIKAIALTGWVEEIQCLYSGHLISNLSLSKSKRVQMNHMINVSFDNRTGGR